MRLLVLSLFSLAGALYSFAAFEAYREEVRAREDFSAPGEPGENLPSEPSRHPEANLRQLRHAFASEDYTDDLQPYLERALAQAPTFYQPPFLLAAFYANRLEQPEKIEGGFEAALTRFPSNGRLHLTFAEWLLTPRATEPYRAYRADSGPGDDDARERAIRHVARATSLEPELTRQALDLLLRFRFPLNAWASVLPDDETTWQLIFPAADRAPRDRDTRRQLLTSYLSDAVGDATLRTVAFFGRKWDEPQIALDASERWHQLALESGVGPELTRATLSLARECLTNAQPDRAYRVVRTTLTAMEERGLAQDSVELLVGMGDIYLARGRVAMAQSLFTEAATLFPFHAPAYLGLARTHQRAGDRDNAIRELRRVLELEPENSQARTSLDVMLERQ